MKLAVLMVAVSLAATAQEPIARPSNWCGFAVPNGGAPKADVLEPSQFAVPRGDLCEQYTYDAGWEDTMVLQLGEGAEDYREWIEMAVEVWNDALNGRQNYFTPISISNERPSNRRISRSFWEDFEDDDEVTLDQEDDENVIYFTSSESGEHPQTYGVAQTWTSRFGNRILESDVYINTYFEEEAGVPVAEIKKLLGYSHDGNFGVYLYVHEIYLTILHEIGHALGLGHIPVSGNIMSYSPSEGFFEQWENTMAMHLHMLHRYSGIKSIGHDFFVDRQVPNVRDRDRLWIGNTMYVFKTPIDNARKRILTNFYTSKVRLGESERLMLNCIYEF